MPFYRPTLTQLVTEARADLGGSGLRWAVNQVVGAVLGGLAHLHYGYQDWIARQAVPFTATDEFLEGWAALVGVVRVPATPATVTPIFQGVIGTTVPAGTVVNRADNAYGNVRYASTADATVDGTGYVSVPLQAITAGVPGNADGGATYRLVNGLQGIINVGSTASPATGGVDPEADAPFRTRMLLRYAAPPQGGDATDYVEWAEAVPGVTNAWVVRNGMGAGTVVVYIMMYKAEAAHLGIPQGTDGVATAENRDVPATGDQLAVANALWPVQPVTALVYVVAPTPSPVNFTVVGLAPDTVANRASISAALTSVLQAKAAPGGTIPLSEFYRAIQGVAQGLDFELAAPTVNVTALVGAIPVLGTVTYV